MFNVIAVLAFVLSFQTLSVGFQTPLATANTNDVHRTSINDVPPAPRNVAIVQSGDSLEVSWAAPSPEPSGDWTYKVELVDEIDKVVETAQNISKSVLTQTFANLFTSNYKAKVYVQTSGGETSQAAESDKSKPAQIALGAASANINFADIADLESESQAKIKWAAAFGITTGYTPTTYNPKKAVSRRQMASFFKRLAGGPAPSGQPVKFKDVTDKEQNKADIDWLSAEKITTGYICTAKAKPDKACTKAGDVVYMPGAVVNRGQMAQFIYKYVGQPYISPDEVNSYMKEFSDSQKLRDNGQAEAVAWLLKYNVTKGYPDGTYKPTTRVSREQMAVFLARLANILNITPYLARETITPQISGDPILPTNFLNIPGLNRKDITKISFISTLPVCNNPIDVSSSKNGSILGCVQNATEIVIGEPLGVKGNPYSADGLFSNLSTGALQSLDFSTISDLGNAISAYAAFAVDSGFVNSAIPNNFVFPNGFGVKSENMAYMFANRAFAQNEIFGEDFAKNATNMNAMFKGGILNSDIDWSETNFSTSTASKIDMFTDTVWNNHFIFAQNSVSRTFLITNSSLSDVSRIKVKGVSLVLKSETANPASFLGLSSPTRGQITKISFQNSLPICPEPFDVSEDGKGKVLACVNNSTEIVIGAEGAVQANANSSYLFANLNSVNGVVLDLANLDTTQVQDMSYMFTYSKLKFTPIWPISGFGQAVDNMRYAFFDVSLPDQLVFPQGFGTANIDMTSMFSDDTLPAGFALPAGFGSAAANISFIFAGTTFPLGFVLPDRFGAAAKNMNSMFNGATLNSDIDWSETNFSTSTASKTDMFTGTVWNDYFIFAQNLASRTFLITNSDISDTSRIKVRGASSVLKSETANPTTFLGIPSPTRDQITKITFQNSFPTCPEPFDLSDDGTAGVLACVKNSTEIVIGANGQVEANDDSSSLFANLTLAAGVDVDLVNLNTSFITNMSNMFQDSKLKSALIWPTNFGSVATNMGNMFRGATLSAGFVLPDRFGVVAKNMNSMFNGVTLNGDIDWSGTDLSVSTASKTNTFQNTVWNGHYILVQNSASRAFLITDSSLSDVSRIKVKGAGSVLKAEAANPASFLGLSSPTRAQITKITFQNTLPACNNPFDVSTDGKSGVLACVNNSTEIVIG
ncbi:MAG: S-layer homology domain-containing protein, partial [Bifidobacteriaceae bacterium]|nr:S-layer homology domain-containing protein [Bifidobacteriaceae bacterium]